MILSSFTARGDILGAFHYLILNLQNNENETKKKNDFLQHLDKITLIRREKPYVSNLI